MSHHDIVVYYVDGRFVLFDLESAQRLQALRIATYSGKVTQTVGKKDKKRKRKQNNESDDEIQVLLDDDAVLPCTVPCYILPVYAYYLHSTQQAQIVAVTADCRCDDKPYRTELVHYDKQQYDILRQQAEQRRLQHTNGGSSDVTKVRHNTVAQRNTVDHTINVVYDVLDDCKIERAAIGNSTYKLASELQSDASYHSHYYLHNHYTNQQYTQPYTFTDVSHAMLVQCAVIAELQRQHRWCSTGLTYGADYLLYHDNPQYVHASHICVVVDGTNSTINAQQLTAVNRLAGAVNKCVLVAYVQQAAYAGADTSTVQQPPWSQYTITLYSTQWDAYVSTNKL